MGNMVRIDNGSTKVEVNDQGEYIVLPLGDDGFSRRFYALVEDFKGKTEEIKAEDDVISALDKSVSISSYMKAETDKLIGEGTCKKVFGDITPSIDLFMDFFYQLVPFFEEYNKRRNSRLDRYNAGRRGSV